jgi:large subunit ribosomal protein L38
MIYRVILKDRTFSTLEFYNELQDQMTPASFAFFQSSHDESLTRFFQQVLEMREPIYEYEHADPGYRPQTRYPIGYAFNTYLDRYKHPQQINKEVLLLRLKNTNPFDRQENNKLKYPLAHKTPWDMPSWVKDDLVDRAFKQGKYKDL